jgi:hypothetical protein
LLGSIVRQGTTKLSKALWNVSKGKVSGLFSGMKESAKEVGISLLAKVGLQKTKEALEAEIEAINSKTIYRSGPGMEEGE